MIKFNFDDYIDPCDNIRMVMHCVGKEEILSFAEILNDNKRTWKNGRNYLDPQYIDGRREMCFVFNRGTKIDFESANCRDPKYIIMEFSDFLNGREEELLNGCSEKNESLDSFLGKFLA